MYMYLHNDIYVHTCTCNYYIVDMKINYNIFSKPNIIQCESTTCITKRFQTWTPPTPQSTNTAPSKTRNDRSTSIVKSTCPGVSIMLIT